MANFSALKSTMKIKAIINFLESHAPLSLQESYDNCGLQVGDPDQECSGILCCLDVTEAILAEAELAGSNLVVAHHPLIFNGLKQITGATMVERVVAEAIRKNIAIYAIHTNLDNLLDGVNARIADLLGLRERSVLQPMANTLLKLITYVPLASLPKVQDALFEAGAGHIGRYSECSFFNEGKGSFRGEEGTNPFVGEPGQRHIEDEGRLEVILPAHLRKPVVEALRSSHPYEEVAYDLIPLANTSPTIGAGLVGSLEVALGEETFLDIIKREFRAGMIKHTALPGRPVKKVALCGGSGSFLIRQAIRAGADVFLTSDIKYHDFFLAEGRIILIDIGHYETEQFTADLLHDVLRQKFLNFAVLKTGLNTNPVRYR